MDPKDTRSSRYGGDAVLPSPDRKHPIGFAIGLYRRDLTFAGFVDFAIVGLITLAFVTQTGLSRIRLSSTSEPPVAAAPREEKADPGANRVTTGAYDTGSQRVLRSAIIRIDRSLFALSPVGLLGQLNKAADEFDNGRPSRVLDALHGADPTDANVLSIRGVTTVLLGGIDNAAAGMHLLTRAREQGHRQATALTGMLMISGPPGMTRDPVRGVKYLVEAVEKGDFIAARFLGMAYIAGTAGVADPALGLRYLRIAADAGDPEALFKVGTAALNGVGMPRDVEEAMRRLRDAAERGHILASSILGRAYLTQYQGGWSVDLSKAVEWLGRGATAGEPNGMYWLGRIYADIAKDPPYHDPPKAIPLFRACAAQRHMPCVFAMGHVLQSGLGVTRDYVAAHAYFSMAAGNGEPKGKERLDQLEKLMSPDEIAKAKQVVGSILQSRPGSR